jgi:hypothetical protein
MTQKHGLFKGKQAYIRYYSTHLTGGLFEEAAETDALLLGQRIELLPAGWDQLDPSHVEGLAGGGALEGAVQEGLQGGG